MNDEALSDSIEESDRKKGEIGSANEAFSIIIFK